MDMHLACLYDPNATEGCSRYRKLKITKNVTISDRLYNQALNGFLRLANSGSAEHQNLLGVMYLCGMGTARDEREAIKWLTAAFEGGYRAAANTLCSLYYATANEFNENRDLAKLWYKRNKLSGSQSLDIPTLEDSS